MTETVPPHFAGHHVAMRAATNGQIWCFMCMAMVVDIREDTE